MNQREADQSGQPFNKNWNGHAQAPKQGLAMQSYKEKRLKTFHAAHIAQLNELLELSD
ncbi:MAG: hypothetical protein LBU32_14645 [Clostridiales bacterium]|jgi:hypothetical protein|nr:hypothetical protein [Clostridiales bacterium]